MFIYYAQKVDYSTAGHILSHIDRDVHQINRRIGISLVPSLHFTEGQARERAHFIRAFYQIMRMLTFAAGAPEKTQNQKPSEAYGRFLIQAAKMKLGEPRM